MKYLWLICVVLLSQLLAFTLFLQQASGDYDFSASYTSESKGGLILSQRYIRFSDRPNELVIGRVQDKRGISNATGSFRIQLQKLSVSRAEQYSTVVTTEPTPYVLGFANRSVDTPSPSRRQSETAIHLLTVACVVAVADFTCLVLFITELFSERKELSARARIRAAAGMPATDDTEPAPPSDPAATPEAPPEQTGQTGNSGHSFPPPHAMSAPPYPHAVHAAHLHHSRI